MAKKMLVDATHPEETRVAIVENYRDSNRLEDFDFGLASKPILRGNIYLAKVMRVEPSLQAAFVEYGGNRHGFLPFGEIHPDYFRIPVADRPSDEEGSEAFIESSDEEIPENEDDAFQQDLLSRDEDSVAFQDDAQDEPVLAPSTTSGIEALPSSQPPILTPFGMSLRDDVDPTVGLITDFGNAAVGGMLTEISMPEAPPENVGGDVQERFVRPPRQRYKIQEVLKRGQVMLIQVVKEERGNKGAALTTFLSLAGRYCVLMPNTDHGGGVSRKITNHQDRRRMKEILDQLDIPDGMAVILRTAGMEQEPPEIQRDLDYLLRLWDTIREQTLQSSAPNLIYEEANLIKRSVRDLYTKDISEILIAGREGFERVQEFMHAIMPDQADKIKLYEDPTPLFARYHVENQIDALHEPVAQLRSGGYLVINPTEALVSIDVNSGRATRERHIEETALKTNLEAAEEIARQLRLRDLAGLVVIDFIDMEDGRNNAAVERRLKDAMSGDRARLQIGRISPFGLMELSRQRLRPSLVEINFEKCPHCAGTGYVRSVDSAALSALRALEEEALRARGGEITLHLQAAVSVYILNAKREVLSRFEKQYGIKVTVVNDESVPSSGYKLERSKTRASSRPETGPAVNTEQVFAQIERDLGASPQAASYVQTDSSEDSPQNGRAASDEQGSRRRDPRRRFRKNGPHGRRLSKDQELAIAPENAPVIAAPLEGNGFTPSTERPPQQENDQEGPRRRRGRRGGRRRGPGERHDRVSSSGNGETPSFVAPVMPSVSVSVLDLDTTPKSLEEERKTFVYAPSTPTLDGAQTQPSSHEIVNPPVENAKAGWWRRITGQ